MFGIDDERTRKEQFFILSAQLEMSINNEMGNKKGNDNIVNIANRIRNIMEKSKVSEQEVEKVIDTLIKAKVKCVMSNDSNYYSICSRLDSIISFMRKYDGGAKK